MLINFVAYSSHAIIDFATVNLTFQDSLRKKKSFKDSSSVTKTIFIDFYLD
jgi:hypothetical protein